MLPWSTRTTSSPPCREQVDLVDQGGFDGKGGLHGRENGVDIVDHGVIHGKDGELGGEGVYLVDN